MSRIILVLAVSLLFSCGGGSGSSDNGSSGGGNGGGSTSSNAKISFDTTSVNFEGEVSDPYSVEPVEILGSVSGSLSNLYIVVDASAAWLLDNVYVETNLGNNTGILNIVPKRPDELEVGTFTNVISVQACEDQDCNRQLQGSPTEIEINFSITGPELSLNNDAVVLEYTESTEDFPEVEIDMSIDKSVPVSGETAGYPNGSIAWLDVIHHWEGQQGTATIRLKDDIPAGTHQETISICLYWCAVREPLNVTVEVSPAPVSISELELEFELNNQSVSEDLEKTIDITAGNVADFEWEATTDVEWLNLSTEQGSTQNQDSLVVSLNEQTVLKKNGIENANVTITDIEGLYPERVIPVTLNQNLVVISAVAPYIGKAGQEHRIKVYGNDIDTQETNIEIGGNAYPALFTAQDKVTFDLPGLSPGTYPVTLKNNTGLTLSNSRYIVLEDISPDAALIPRDAGWSFQSFIYDEQRRAIYFENSPNGIVRIQYRDGGWQTDTIDIYDLSSGDSKVNIYAMTPDGRYLLMAKTGLPVVMFDLDSLEVSHEVSGLSLISPLAFFSNLGAIGVSNAVEYMNFGEKPVYFPPLGYFYYQVDTESTLKLSSDLGTGLLDTVDGLRKISSYSWGKSVGTIERADLSRFTSIASHYNYALVRGQLLKLIEFDTDSPNPVISEFPEASVLDTYGRHVYSYDSDSNSLRSYEFYLLDNAWKISEFADPIPLPEELVESEIEEMAISLHGSLVFIVTDSQIVIQPVTKTDFE